jgi:hypothetical protein
VTPANAGDGSVAKELLTEALPASTDAPVEATADEAADAVCEGAPAGTEEMHAEDGGDESTVASMASVPHEPALEVYGDSAYGVGDILAHLDEHAVAVYVKVQPPSAPEGQFSKDSFGIDLDNATVTCPQQHTVPIRARSDGSGSAYFGNLCAQCPLRSQCTKSPKGRTVNIHPHESLLARARQQQRSNPAWLKRYRATRPKVERKLAHLMRRKHGARRARMRGRIRIAWDFALLAASANLQRLAQLFVPVPPAPAAP